MMIAETEKAGRPWSELTSGPGARLGGEGERERRQRSACVFTSENFIQTSSMAW